MTLKTESRFREAGSRVLRPSFAALLLVPQVTLVGLPPGGKTFTTTNHPKDESMGSRSLTLTDTIYIEREDFREVDDPKFFGLAPGKEVRHTTAYP
eukprot:scaffold56582_cov32-Tisochrysis_lutea.AAC.3